MNSLPVEKIKPLLAKNDVSFLGLFGSFARGEERPDSDMDFLVRFSKPKSLLGLIGLELELSDVLGRKVDLVTDKSVYPPLRPFIERDLTPLYGSR